MTFSCNEWPQFGTVYRQQIKLCCTMIILAFSLVLSVYVFNYWCRVSGLVPFGYPRRRYSCYISLFVFTYCLAMRISNKNKTSIFLTEVPVTRNSAISQRDRASCAKRRIMYKLHTRLTLCRVTLNSDSL